MAPKPTLEQSDIVETFVPGDKHLVIQAGAGCGKTSVLKMAARAVPKRKGLYIAYNKALRNDQPVLTPDGWKVIGDMRIGDLVIGLDGKAHGVTKVHPRGIRPMFEVVFSDGTIVVADGDHLWLTQTITYDARPVSPVKWRIRTTQQIADTVHQKHRVPHLQAAAELNQRHDLPISSYLLGALLGDGSFCHHAVLFSCAEDDLVELVRAELPEGHAINAQQDGGRGRSWLISGGRKGSQGSNKVMVALRDLGLHGHRSGTKFVPPMYLYASAEQRLALLQGLMDTDGCASGVQSFFRTTSKQLADDVVFLAQSLGGVATIGLHKNGSYLVNVRLAVGVCPFRLPRKAEAWMPRTRDEQTPRKIVEVREAAPAEATCISIDADDHLFLTAGCIPTHNSIQVEAAASFPDSVTCKTSHGLAFGAVGRKYAHRLKAARMKSEDVAKLLRINSPIYTPTTIIPPAHVARIVMATIGAFTRSARTNILSQSVPRIPGFDDPETMQTLAAEIPLLAQKAWKDILDPRGQLPFSHDCQPPGTLVRRLVQRDANGDGTFARTEFEDVPIEQIRQGDQVVSFDVKSRRGYVRRAGRRVTAVGGRHYKGDLITVTTSRGRSSSYTAEHRCVVRLDCDLSDGNYVVYLARRGNNYRIGRTTWRTKSQGNALGIRRRAERQSADAMWILSVHATDADAALAEALTAHTWQIPTWQFHSVNETMPLERFWSAVGYNGVRADLCLQAHGLDIQHPFWKKGDGWNTTRRPVVMRAVNLLSGMLVLEADEIEPGPKGELRADDGANGWAPITVSRSHYDGPVYNLDVDVDHTYIADGIATHNCYLKMWCLSEPQLTRYDYVLLDEAQDSNPPVAKVVNQQRHAQLVLVGDDAQSIYGWRGADNAMAKFNGARKTLSQSFRFGPAVADEANVWLEYLDAPLRLRGFDQINSRIIELDEPDAILCRTNGTAMAQVMQQLQAGRRVSLVGGGDQIRKLAEAAIQLKDGRGCSHPELFAFKNWGELQDYVEEDEGSDLRPFVNLIDEHGPDVVLDTVSKLVTANPEVEISTSHKAKGREWHRVQVAADFPEPKPTSDGKPGRVSRPDAMLAYVTVTRAQYDLDNTGLSWIHEYV